MVAGGDHVGPGIDRLQENVFRDAETAGGILTIDDDEVELQIGDQTRQTVPDGHAPGFAHHVTQKTEAACRSSHLCSLKNAKPAFREHCIQRDIMRFSGH